MSDPVGRPPVGGPPVGDPANAPSPSKSDELLPSIDFATFVVSLSHSALMHLGEARNPETDAVEEHLPLARQTIDLLGILEEKTKGNLTGAEERLLTQVLTDLRLRFLEKSKGG